MKTKYLDCPNKSLPINEYCGLCGIINKGSMKCKKCGYDNPIVKKTCQQCSSILEGETINNVTGEIGYRNADGSFTAYKDGKTPTLKQQIDKITEETEDKIQQIVLDHYQQTGVMMLISLEYVEMTDKLSGGRKELMPIIKISSTL